MSTIENCRKCGNDLCKIQFNISCGDCEFNHAWDEESKRYISDIEIIIAKNLLRNHVAEERECDLGHSYGEGCYLFFCSKCKHLQDHIPIIDR